jgi:hypothetical protein
MHTPEDGQVGRTHVVKESISEKPTYNKAARRGRRNLQYPLQLGSLCRDSQNNWQWADSGESPQSKGNELQLWNIEVRGQQTITTDMTTVSSRVPR